MPIIHMHTPSKDNILSANGENKSSQGMDLSPDTHNFGCAHGENAGNVFPTTDFEGNN